MNAVILLVWLAGADAAPQAQKPAAITAPTQKPAPGGAPLRPAPLPPPIHNGCGDPCCDHGGHKLFGRLRGLFHRGCDDDCKDDCRGGHPLFHRRHQDDCCNDGGGHKLFGFLHRHRDRDCCDDGGGHKLFGRFHNIFRRHDDDCCVAAAPAVIHPHPVPGKPPAGEKIAPPKKGADKKAELTPPPPAGLTLDAPALTPNR